MKSVKDIARDIWSWIQGLWSKIATFVKNHKVGTCAVVGGLVVVTVAAIGISHIIKNQKEEEVLPPELPPVEEIVAGKVEEVLGLEGTGNEEILNEDTRDTSIQYIVSTRTNFEKVDENGNPVDESIATLYVTYNYQTEYGEGEDLELIDNSTTLAFTYVLSQEQIDAINSGTLSDEELAKLIQEGFVSTPKENIEFVRNPSGRDLDDEDEYTLKEGIKKSLLDRPEEYVGYTDAANVTIISFYNDDASNTYNIVGIISEGANTEYFIVTKPYTSREELEQIRREDITNVCIGQSITEKGFVVESKLDASADITIKQINNAYNTMIKGSITANKYVIEQADHVAEQTTDVAR